MLSLIFSVLIALGVASTPIPDLKLVGQDGKPLTVHSLKSHFIFLTFLYSRCPAQDMCPKTMKMSKALLADWKKTAPELPLKVLAISFDPDHDTPKILAQFGKSYGVNPKDFILATGDLEDISKFSENFNIVAFPSAGQPFAHNMKNILIGPGLVEIKQFKDNEFNSAQVIKAAKEHLNQPKG